MGSFSVFVIVISDKHFGVVYMNKNQVRYGIWCEAPFSFLMIAGGIVYYILMWDCNN